MTIKFPVNKERYRQAIECINERDRNKFRTQADYITAAVLSYEGKVSDDEASIPLLYQKMNELTAIMEEIRDEKKKE